MGKKNNYEEIQSRREFFKKAAKAALPILGVALLVSNPIVAKATETPMSCYYSCTGSCYGGCTACYGTCLGGCQGNCKGCTGSCREYCTTTCRGTCYHTSYY